jgi:hypothetical protein
MTKGKKKFKNTQKGLLDAETYLCSYLTPGEMNTLTDVTLLYIANNHYDKHELNNE